jgi:hypothetical protein
MKESAAGRNKDNQATPGNVEEDLWRMSIQCWQVKIQGQQDWRRTEGGEPKSTCTRRGGGGGDVSLAIYMRFNYFCWV